VKRDAMSNAGLLNLIEHYRKMFRVPENLDHYSKEDLQRAERKFIRFALQKGNL
jgi:hypothetical protein